MPEEINTSRTLAEKVGRAMAALVWATFTLAFITWMIMGTWNHVVTEMLGLPEIAFFEAICLYGFFLIMSCGTKLLGTISDTLFDR